jgi:hypothetical protein
LDSFYEGELYLQNINGSHITLVPKNDNPMKVGEAHIPLQFINQAQHKATSKQIVGGDILTNTQKTIWIHQI